MKQSKRFTLSKTDVEKWINNAAVFLAPALLLFLVSIQSGSDWREALKFVELWLLNTVIDILRKFIAGKPAK